MNKALVTQSSAAIPIVPLYISILYKVMKEKGVHEGCIQQMYRLFHQKLYSEQVPTDEQGRIRMDDWEMAPEIQHEVSALWNGITEESLEQKADLEGFWDDFYRLFGFRALGVDYKAEVSPELPIPSLAE